jgi:hypothetical protein
MSDLSDGQISGGFLFAQEKAKSIRPGGYGENRFLYFLHTVVHTVLYAVPILQNFERYKNLLSKIVKVCTSRPT